jgi:hypothetical protein
MPSWPTPRFAYKKPLLLYDEETPANIAPPHCTSLILSNNTDHCFKINRRIKINYPEYHMVQPTEEDWLKALGQDQRENIMAEYHFQKKKFSTTESRVY